MIFGRLIVAVSSRTGFFSLVGDLGSHITARIDISFGQAPLLFLVRLHASSFRGAGFFAR